MAFSNQSLLRIEVGKNGVEQRGPLRYSSFQSRPFVSIEQHRNRVHGPRTFLALGVAVDVVRDAVGLNELTARLPAAAELLQAHAPDSNRQLAPMAAGKA